MRSTNLTNQFLIAMPGLVDPNFRQAVTYVCAHNEKGAMGIIINRPLDLDLDEVLTQMDMKTPDPKIQSIPVYQGGPVQCNRGFVIIHQINSEWGSSINVGDEIGVTTSRGGMLKSISEGKGPKESLIALGYAGWRAGQLEQELMKNAWLSSPVDSEIIFNTPYEKRWESSAALLGIDMEHLSPDIGHA